VRFGAISGALPVKYVYLLESVEHPDESYVGLTDNLKARFAAHNAGQSPHTAKFKPWRLVTYIAFSDETKAVAFERYLKSASGRAFAKKRLK
jgi:putative endonuclease